MKTIQGQAPRWFHYCFLLSAAAFLYFDVFVPPATPIFFNVDHLNDLHNATRMLDGQMIYRDFFQIIPPGTELVYLALFRVFGVRAWAPNLMLVMLGLSLTWLCTFMSGKILSGFTAYLPSLLFLLIAFHSDLDATHHWYSVLAVTSALALVVEKRSPKRLAGAAALCALASFFTQVRGVLAVVALAIFLWWEHRKMRQSRQSLWKAEVILASSFGAVTVALNQYFIRAAGWQRFLWCTVTFGSKYYSADAPSNSLQAYMAFMPTGAHGYDLTALLPWVFIHALVPFVYLLFFARFWSESKKNPDQPWDRLMLLSLVGFFLFVGVAPAPGYGRLGKASLPGLIILGWFLSSHGKLPSLARQALWLGAVFMLARFALHRQTKEWAYLDTPVGRVAFFDPVDRDRYEWLLSHTRRSQPYFDSSGDTYFLLGLKSPAEISFLSKTDYTRPDQVRNLVESLEEQHVPLVLWDPHLDPGDHGRQVGDNLEPLRDYLQTHYHVVKVFEDSRLLERSDSPVKGTSSKTPVPGPDPHPPTRKCWRGVILSLLYARLIRGTAPRLAREWSLLANDDQGQSVRISIRTRAPAG
jgi:hypothetical protein